MTKKMSAKGGSASGGKNKFIIHTSLFILLIGIGLFGLAKSAWAACNTPCTKSGTTWTCPDVSYDCVNAVMSNGNFNYNDTIYLSGTLVPSATWTSPLSVSKGCTIKGAGSSVIIITGNIGNSTNILQYYADNTTISNNYGFKVSDFKIVGTNGEQGIYLSSGGWGNQTAPITNNIVTNMRFQDLIAAVVVDGPTYGVASNNDMLNTEYPIRNVGYDHTSWDEFGAIHWKTDATSQSDCAKHQTGIDNVSCFFYFEDNYIHYSNDYAGGNIAWTSTGQGGRFVIRSNSYDFTGASKTSCSGYACMINVFETHDSRANKCPNTGADPSYAPMGAIFYGNLVAHDQGTGVWKRNWQPFIGRGGKVIFSNNYFTDLEANPMGIGIFNQFMDGCVIDYDISVQHINDTYFYNNYFESSLLQTNMNKDGCYGWNTPSDLGACVSIGGHTATAIATGTATGGGVSGVQGTSFIDTTKDFVAAGVVVGDWVMNDRASCEANHQPYCSDPNNPLWYCCYSGTREGCQIQSITNSNHTLNCTSGTYLDYQIVSGDAYYIVHDKSGMTSNNSPTSSWWSQSSTGTFDGSADAAHGGGAGCGTLANMPSSCTYGAAYWATSQGNCGSLSGWVGQSSDRIHGSIQGTLYKCSSSNSTPGTFSAYWTPYTYPHPLRGIIDHNAPAAPSGLNVQ